MLTLLAIVEGSKGRLVGATGRRSGADLPPLRALLGLDVVDRRHRGGARAAGAEATNIDGDLRQDDTEAIDL
jgi:hypothetical protein